MYLFCTFFFFWCTLEFQWLKQPSAVSILNSGSVSPAGERICKTKHVFLLSAAKRIVFPSEMVKRFPAHYVSLKEFAIGYGSTWSFCWAVAAAPAELGWWERGGGGGIRRLWASPVWDRRCTTILGINPPPKKKGKREQSIVIKPPGMKMARSQMARSKVRQSCMTCKVASLLTPASPGRWQDVKGRGRGVWAPNRQRHHENSKSQEGTGGKRALMPTEPCRPCGAGSCLFAVDSLRSPWFYPPKVFLPWVQGSPPPRPRPTLGFCSQRLGGARHDVSRRPPCWVSD